MQRSEFMIITAACLMLLIGVPSKAFKGDQNQERQEQQAFDEDVMAEPFDESDEDRYRITYRAPTLKEDKVADIIWLKKASEVALDAGVPTFNVVKKEMSKQFHPKSKRQLNVVEGVIELENDPMAAEYDAHEITSLVLTEIE